MFIKSTKKGFILTLVLLLMFCITFASTSTAEEFNFIEQPTIDNKDLTIELESTVISPNIVIPIGVTNQYEYNVKYTRDNSGLTNHEVIVWVKPEHIVNPELGGNGNARLHWVGFYEDSSRIYSSSFSNGYINDHLFPGGSKFLLGKRSYEILQPSAGTVSHKDALAYIELSFGSSYYPPVHWLQIPVTRVY